MEMRQLEAFAAVVDLGSFTRAADHLGVAQPAISQSIRTLERDLGVSLMSRSRSGVVLSDAGLQLIASARRILAEAQLGERQTKMASQGQIGTLRIGFLGSATSPFLPMLIHDFRSDFPNVSIDLSEMTPTQQYAAFEQNRIDVGCNRPLPSHLREEFFVHPVYQDRLMAALPASDDLVSRDVISARDLSGREMVMFHSAQAPDLMAKAMRFLGEATVPPAIVSQPMQMSTVLLLVASGIGPSIVPGCVRHFHQPGVEFRELEGPLIPIPLEVAYRRDNDSPLVRNWVRLLDRHRASIRELMEG